MASSANYRGDWKRRRLLVLARDGYRCHWCGRPANVADHVVPIAEGGTHDLANLVASCWSCNSSRAGTWAYANGRGRWSTWWQPRKGGGPAAPTGVLAN